MGSEENCESQTDINPPNGQHGFFCPTREASKTDHTEFFDAYGDMAQKHFLIFHLRELLLPHLQMEIN
ncbi:hypothetical protein TNCV_2725631 [Trichonephila clavipes]|nr:hypothetical protein TNCV_2725631 [Trichonephila clavipes]